jgi:hypothetical protein
VETVAELFAHHEVTVHSSQGAGKTVRLTEYGAWWASQRDGSDSPWRYLKDWHLASTEPDYAAYSVPQALGEDWLNEHWAAASHDDVSASGGDHRFVYIGPAGSVTRLHADVLFSYSWSANVVGSKRWLLVPADQRGLVSDAAARPLASSLSELPGVTPIEVVQRKGELLFVPSGWYHEVTNLEDTISINHNWLNAFNVHWALTRISQVLKDVRTGLAADDANDGSLCEELLGRRCGMGLGGIADLLEGVIHRRLDSRGEQPMQTRPSVPQQHVVLCAPNDVAFAIERASMVLTEVLDLVESEYEPSSLDGARLEAISRQRRLLTRRSKRRRGPAGAAPPP